MGADQLVMRMLCAEGNIDAQIMRTGALQAEDWRKLTMAMGSLSNAGIFIDDSSGIKVNEIRSKCRRLQQEHGLGMVIIDYMQLISGSGKCRRKPPTRSFRNLTFIKRISKRIRDTCNRVITAFTWCRTTTRQASNDVGLKRIWKY